MPIVNKDIYFGDWDVPDGPNTFQSENLDTRRAHGRDQALVYETQPHGAGDRNAGPIPVPNGR